MKRSMMGVSALLLLAVCGAALAGSALPRMTVDVAFRKVELSRLSDFPSARLTCTWSQGTASYACVTWAPSAKSTGVIVQGRNAKVFRRRGVQACARTQAGIVGCSETTLAPACRYALTTYSANAATGSVRMINVCRPGWLLKLR